MNQDLLAGRWDQLVGTAAERWGALIHDPGLEAAGRQARLAGRLRARLASSQACTERQLNDFMRRYRHWDAP